MPEQTLFDLGGDPDAPLIHIAVANGFPPPTYHPLFDPLTERYRVISLPPRPLWSDPPPPESVNSWQSLADDLLAGLRARDLTGIIAVGHSFGCVASMLAVAAEPSRFRALVMLDPTFLPKQMLYPLAALRFVGGEARMPLVKRALNRRRRFPSVDEAFAYWRGKALFEQWSDSVLRLYAESLTRPAADGDGVELAWSPEWEARYYQTLYTRVWEDVPRLRGNHLPILTIRGTTSNTFSEGAAAQLRSLLPEMTYHEIEGHGHLFPQSAPDATREIVTAWLGEIDG